MQKVVIDTNVLVSSIIQKSYPYLIINELFIEQKIELCVSDEVLQEYYEVLNRKKFSKYPDFILKADALLAKIESNATKFYPTTKVHVITDLNDNKFLELAVESKTKYIITGNSTDFTMQTYKQTKIISPKEYWENYHPDKF